MRFDVIVGNPPYQLSDCGFGRSSTPLYHLFVNQAKKLNPSYLTMIIPSRWFGGGKGLSKFRSEMLSDNRIRRIVDFEDARDVFPEIDLAGGVSYFLWDRDNPGLCSVTDMREGVGVTSRRKLNEFKSFIRHCEAASIVRKVLSHNEASMSQQVSSRKPFGLSTTERPKGFGDLVLRWQKGEGPYPRDEITTGVKIIDQWKVITSYAGYDHAGNPGIDGRRRVFSKIDIMPPGMICNETYLVIGHYNSNQEAENLVLYMKTLFFRFLVSQCMHSHHITKDTYLFVPSLDMSKSWTDEDLVSRYKLTPGDTSFIESKIRPFNR